MFIFKRKDRPFEPQHLRTISGKKTYCFSAMLHRTPAHFRTLEHMNELWDIWSVSSEGMEQIDIANDTHFRTYLRRHTNAVQASTVWENYE